MDFDAFDLCTPELQKKLLPMREKFKEIEDKKVEEALVMADKKAKDNNAPEIAVTKLPYCFENGKFIICIFSKKNKKYINFYLLFFSCRFGF